jgi:hypothetical protein
LNKTRATDRIQFARGKRKVGIDKGVVQHAAGVITGTGNLSASVERISIVVNIRGRIFLIDRNKPDILLYDGKNIG